MDFSQYLVPAVMAGCLVVGYCIKSIKSLQINDYIPTVLAVLGALIAVSLNGFSVEVAIDGAVSGLASTGLHQAFTRFLDGLNGSQQKDGE